MKHKQQAILQHKISEIASSLPESDKKKPSSLLEMLTKKYPQYSRLPKNLLSSQISLFLNPNDNPLPEENPITNSSQPHEKPLTLKRKKNPFSIESDLKSALFDRQKALDSCPSLDQLGGLSNILPQVLQLIYLPLKYKHLFNTLNLNPPRGILLTGPPGSGKTALAMAIGKHIKETLGFTFIFNSGTESLCNCMFCFS